MKKWIFISVLALSVMFCSIGAPKPTLPPTLDVNPASTLMAAASATAEAEVTPTSSLPAIGTITGKLSYPSEGIPPLRIVAFKVNSDEFSYIDTINNQPNYSFDLAPGTYHIVAYAIGKSAISGGYTDAVICGLAVECANHSLIDVTVTAGVTTPNIDPGDFYAPEGSFPPMPSIAGTAEMGTITGRLNYPAETLPPMRVTAFEVVSGEFSYIDTQPGQSNYTFELPVGTYHIVAYSIASGAFPGGFPSGYTNAVTCGLTDECNDHALINVVVESGVTLSDINPADSYAPEGSFPPMPGE